MTWAAITRTPAAWATDTGITGQQQTALAGLTVPADLATPGSLAATAATSAANRSLISAARQSLATVVILPWQSGTAERGRSVSSSLTPTSAQTLLGEQAAGFAAMVAFMVPADTAAQLAQKLTTLNSVFPSPKLAAAIRVAGAFATHETDKFSLVNNPESLATEHTSGQREHDTADAVISLAEAVTGDTSPADLLANFSASRANRHAGTAAALTGYGGAIEWGLYLAGDLQSQLQGISVPNPSAPYSAAFALLGTVAALAPLKQELGL